MTDRTFRLLIVEDNPADARLVREYLREYSARRFEIEHVTRLSDAESRLAKPSLPVDVILLDLTLPDAKGMETVDRAVAFAGGVPIVVMTGYEDEDMALGAVDRGAQDYLSKGELTSSLLIRAIRYAIGRAEVVEELRIHKQRYELAVAGARDGLWDMSLTEKRVYFSPRWKEILGYADDEIGTHPEEWLNRISEHDRPRVMMDFERHLSGRSASFQSEYRAVCKDRTLRWVMCRGVAVRNEAGVAVRIAGSLTDITARKETEARLDYAAFHDELTNVANRALFLNRLGQAMSRRNSSLRRSQSTKSVTVVVSIGLDRFRNINDSFGHQFGDEVLREVASRFHKALRPEDTLARVAADEFAVLLESCDAEDDGVVVAKRLQRQLKAPMKTRNGEVFVTASIGITSSNLGYTSPEEYLRDAGVAMHRAKQAGGDCELVFGQEMHSSVLSRLHLEGDLRRGIDAGEMLPYYQPIVDTRTGRVEGFEALLRWRRPNTNTVSSPDAFLAVAEEAGLMDAIFAKLLPSVLDQFAVWRRLSGQENLGLNVNLSRTQFGNPNLLPTIVGELERAGLPPSVLSLEITESAIFANTEVALRTLHELRDNGLRLCLDDFGTGYSSLSCLHEFPIDAMKIDKSFTQQLDSDRGGTKMLQAILGLAEQLRLEVTVEGVETERQLEILQSLEARRAQGYHLGMPGPAEQADQLLKTSLAS